MKFTFSIEGDYYEDNDDLLNILRSGDYISANESALEKIRRKLKYDTVPDEWVTFLEELRSELFVE